MRGECYTGPVRIPTYAKQTVRLDNDVRMPCVELGTGCTPVVYLPGAGDGLASVSDAAAGLAWTFRRRAPHHRMHVIGRREDIPAGYSIEDHARDVVAALDRLALGPVLLECNSAAGPIGQQIAAHRPDLVRALVLASTAHRLDATATAVIRRWLDLATAGRWGDLAWDTTLVTYRAAGRFRSAAPLAARVLAMFSRPRDPLRFPRLMEGLLGLDQSDLLARIARPTLVFGGAGDPVFGAELQREMAGRLPDARFVSVPGYLHGADLESPEYPRAVTRLLAETA